MDATKKKKSAMPDQIADAVALREAGYSTLAIAQRTGISVRSLHRHFAKYSVKKGALKQDLIEAARQELLQRVTSDSAIKAEAARQICDDLAQARHLREILIDASDLLKATSLRDAALVMRAAAAYSTAIKNTSDMIRHALPHRVLESSTDDLPQLIVTEITADQVAELREQAANKAAAYESASG